MARTGTGSEGGGTVTGYNVRIETSAGRFPSLHPETNPEQQRVDASAPD